MKLAYQQKVLDNISAMEKRLGIIMDVAQGNRVLTNDEILKLVKEVKHLSDSNKAIIEIVPTQ